MDVWEFPACERGMTLRANSLKPDRSLVAELHQTLRVHHISQLRFFSVSEHEDSMAVEISQFIHPWYENEEFGTVMAVTRATFWFGEDPVAELSKGIQVDQEAKPPRRAKST